MVSVADCFQEDKQSENIFEEKKQTDWWYLGIRPEALRIILSLGELI